MVDKSDDRFAHLLQPIKDLAENWNVDIACELAEYIVRSCRRCDSRYFPSVLPAQRQVVCVQGALEDLTFSFKGGKSLNFAQGT